jgi:hypothetical protein
MKGWRTRKHRGLYHPRAECEKGKAVSLVLCRVLGDDHAQCGFGDGVGRFADGLRGNRDIRIPEAGAYADYFLDRTILEEREKRVGAVDCSNSVGFELRKQ